MQNQSFDQLNLMPSLLRAVKTEGYERPTPIQAAAIPHLIAGRDLIGCAKTGTGKTAAFALPILQILSGNRKKAPPRGARSLVLTPTRELAAQVGESFKTYGRHLGLTHALVFGGVGQGPQVKALSRGVDILVATPGRLLDLINQKHISLSSVEFFVLDEADRMLDMGFLPDMKRVIAMLPRERQTLLFSATLAPEIRNLAVGLLRDPVSVAVSPPDATVDKIDERVLFVDEGDKRALLTDLLKDQDVDRALVFTRTKHGANRLVKQLGQVRVEARAIHGNKSQTARIAALEDFRAGRCRVLVATDIAARGIDVDGISHVVNYDLPNVPESYIHRIGRTARAGASGIAISFCAAPERAYLRDIERMLKRPVPVIKDHPYHCAKAANSTAAAPAISPRNQHNPNRNARMGGGKPGYRPGRKPDDRRQQSHCGARGR
ncbi:MAG: DEAD/DEAH box helicase [Pseudomonadota bacterium]